MKENKITIIINKSIDEVFEFTINPKNTPLWIESIAEEVSDEYPPKINTKYKNRGKDSDWNVYKVVEFKRNKIFTLTELDGNYSVKYTYNRLGENKTEMTYFEWVKKGEIQNPFTQKIIDKLKSTIENKQ